MSSIVEELDPVKFTNFNVPIKPVLISTAVPECIICPNFNQNQIGEAWNTVVPETSCSAVSWKGLINVNLDSIIWKKNKCHAQGHDKTRDSLSEKSFEP